jgi:membrane associated rhomboid family serine protease
MLPLNDHNPTRTVPFVNYLLIAANVLMFLWELSLGPYGEPVLANVAFVPANFWRDFVIVDAIKITISMFLHGGWLHLAGNMLYLWIFGDNVEDRLGHLRYLCFYLLCGFGATFAHAFVNARSGLPAIGASGAIAGVLGAYIMMFPRARVATLFPIFIFIIVRDIPAVFLLGFWFVIQLFVGVTSLGVSPEQGGGVAYFAHIGGFALGMVLIVFMGGFRRAPVYPRGVKD